MKAKRKKDKDKNKSAKRLNKPERKRPSNSPYKVIVRDWGLDAEDHREIELNPNSKLELHIDGKIYRVGINKKNKCLEFDTLETNLFLQPITTKCFLVKGNTKKEEK